MVCPLNFDMQELSWSLEADQAQDVGQQNEKQSQGCDTDEISCDTPDKGHHLNAHLYTSKHRVLGRLFPILIVFDASFHGLYSLCWLVILVCYAL